MINYLSVQPRAAGEGVTSASRAARMGGGHQGVGELEGDAWESGRKRSHRPTNDHDENPKPLQRIPNEASLQPSHVLLQRALIQCPRAGFFLAI
jgi:hypothetical protein